MLHTGANMNYTEQRNRDHAKWVDAYEHNLSLTLKVKQGEAQQIIEAKKMQDSYIKMYLWINIIFVGLAIKIVEYHPDMVAFILFLGVDVLAISALLFALIEARYMLYPTMPRASYFASLPNNMWMKTQGLLSAINSYTKVNKYNGIMLIRKGRWVRQAQIITVVSFLLFLGLGFSIFQNKVDAMASQPTTPPTTPVTGTPPSKRDLPSSPKK